MTMTDLSKWTQSVGYTPEMARVDKARTWLIDSGHYTEADVTHAPEWRIHKMMDGLYRTGWAGFEADTIIVENASAWELSW